MSAIQYFREWLAEFSSDMETLESMRDAIQSSAIRGLIDDEIDRIEEFGHGRISTTGT